MRLGWNVEGEPGICTLTLSNCSSEVCSGNSPDGQEVSGRGSTKLKWAFRETNEKPREDIHEKLTVTKKQCFQQYYSVNPQQPLPTLEISIMSLKKCVE